MRLIYSLSKIYSSIWPIFIERYIITIKFLLINDKILKSLIWLMLNVHNWIISMLSTLSRRPLCSNLLKVIRNFSKKLGPLPTLGPCWLRIVHSCKTTQTPISDATAYIFRSMLARRWNLCRLSSTYWLCMKRAPSTTCILILIRRSKEINLE